MKIILMTFLILLTSCELRPKKPGVSGGKQVGADGSGGNKPGGPQGAPPVEINLEPTESVDDYLSIGSYLQSELSRSPTSKTVKIFVMIRQENSVGRNFDTLKESLKPLAPAVAAAIDAAKSKGYSTVEFEIELGVLKASLGIINKAVSSIELSLGTIKE